MQSRLVAILLSFMFAATAAAARLPPDARIGVLDALAPHLSAGIGSATDTAKAPTIRDDWNLVAVAREQAVMPGDASFCI